MPRRNRTYCMNCFTAIDDGSGRCPRCGWTNEGQEPEALPFGTVLNDRYLIGQAVRKNGAGFTYSALESTKNEKVEVREFFPDTIAFRDPNGITVKPAAGTELKFADYLSEFERFTRQLIQISDIGDLIEVRDTFSANNTQYVVFRFTPSVTLRQYVQEGGPLTWEECEVLFLPLIRSLSAMSARGVEHLGISPDTLRVTDGGRMFLSDFELHSVRRAGTDLVEDIYPGCWALEQYSRTKLCDEVTDVYGLCASIFYALSGETPAEAPKRRQDPKLMIARTVVRSLPNHVVSAIANGLQVDVERRTSSFSRLLAELTAAPKVITSVQELEIASSLPTGSRRRPHSHSVPLFVWLFLSFVITLGVIFVVGTIWFEDSDYSPQSILETIRNPVPSAPETETFEVPALIGQKLSDVQGMVGTEPEYNFTLDVTETVNESIPAGQIMEQYPLAGEEMQAGGRVRVTVSSGSAMRELPEVAGKPYEEVMQQLQEMGFSVAVDLVESDSVEGGLVIGYWEDHQPGEKFPAGAAIKLLVSGAETTDPAA